MQRTTLRLVHMALALGIGSLGGLVGWAVGLPLPFMLGAMLATMAAALAGLPMEMPKAVRNAVAPVLGVMFGSAISVDALPAASTVFSLSLLVSVHLMLTIGLGWLYFRWVGLDPATSYFAAVPGNFLEMLLFADGMGADLRAVAVVHTVRLVAAVSILSFGLRWLISSEDMMFVPPPHRVLTATDLMIFIGCGITGFAAARLVRLPAAPLFGPSPTVVISAMTAPLCGSSQTHPGTSMPSGGGHIIRATKMSKQCGLICVERSERTDRSDPTFLDLIRRIKGQLRHHKGTQGSGQFPRPRAHIPREEIFYRGRKVGGDKKLSPTRPHPSALHSEFFHKIVGPGVGIVDPLLDKLTGPHW